MEDQEIGNIFPDGYDDDQNHRLEDGRKNDIIKENEDSEEDDDNESGDESENEDGSKKKKKKKNTVQEKKKTKRKVDIFRFKPDMLTNQDRGIRFLNDNFDKIKLFDKNEKGVFDELKALDKLVNYYKEWHFHFMPKYDYQYFLDRCTDFGKNNLIKTYMNNVRRIHKGEIQWKDLINDLQDENQQNINDNTDNQAAPTVNQATNNAQPANQNRNVNNSSLNDTNISRTIDTNKIPKHIKDIYLPSTSQIKNNLANESSYARSTNTSRIPNQSQQSQDSQIIDKTNQSQKKKTQTHNDSEDFRLYEQSQEEDDEQMKQLIEMDYELKMIQEEINRQEQQLQQMDNPYDYDDMDDIKIKKKQQDD